MEDMGNYGYTLFRTIPLSAHYLAIYIDATFIATRRDQQVSKEAYYTILEFGIRYRKLWLHIF